VSTDPILTFVTFYFLGPTKKHRWELYQGRIDSCGAGFPSDDGRACRTRFKFIIWPCLFTVSPTLSPIDLCKSM
jgi:hypothetical protein